MYLRQKLIIGAIGTWIAALTVAGCAPRYTIRSYPNETSVYVKDLVTQEKKFVGKTPLTLKKTNEMGDVFMFAFEKDSFIPKSVIMNSKGSENMTVEVTLDPMQENKAVADNQTGNGQGNQSQPSSGDGKKSKDAKEDEVKDMSLRLALLENTIAMYKDALFSGRYGGGMAKFDRDHTDEIVDHLFAAQQQIMLKNYPKALEEIDQTLLIDEYVPQAHLIKGTVHYINQNFKEAKLAWERALKIDPYNAQAYQYLKLVNKKLGLAPPPDKPSMLRAPASAPWAKSLRDEKQP